MRDFGESQVVLFVTTVLSHVTMLPTLHYLHKRRYMFELCAVLFGLTTSFMYHTCESFDITLVLTEKQWHRLDNMGIITMMGVWYTYLASFPIPAVEMTCKYLVVFVTIVSQQQHPWDVRFTVAPILLFGLQPVVQHCLINRRPPRVHRRGFALGVLWVLLAVPFFVLGLDDAHDPYRVFHGLWHFCGGLAMYYAWTSVVSPTVIPAPAAGLPKAEVGSA